VGLEEPGHGGLGRGMGRLRGGWEWMGRTDVNSESLLAEMLPGSLED
jgi:hypothetical protein